MDPFQESHTTAERHATLAYFLPIIFAQGCFIPPLRLLYNVMLFPPHSAFLASEVPAQLSIKRDKDGWRAIVTGDCLFCKVIRKQSLNVPMSGTGSIGQQRGILWA